MQKLVLLLLFLTSTMSFAQDQYTFPSLSPKAIITHPSDAEKYLEECPGTKISKGEK